MIWRTWKKTAGKKSSTQGTINQPHKLESSMCHNELPNSVSVPVADFGKIVDPNCENCQNFTKESAKHSLNPFMSNVWSHRSNLGILFSFFYEQIEWILHKDIKRRNDKPVHQKVSCSFLYLTFFIILISYIYK